jgi:hypothetical protein
LEVGLGFRGLAIVWGLTVDGLVMALLPPEHPPIYCGVIGPGRGRGGGGSSVKQTFEDKGLGIRV